MVSEQLSMKSNMLWNSIGSMVRLACNWLITIAVVRLSHGFDAAGALSLAMSVCNVVMPFAEFRLRTVHVTDVKGEHTAGEYIGLRIITSVLAFVLGVVYGFATCDLSILLVVCLYLAANIVATFTEGLHAIDQRNMRMDYIGKSYIMEGVGNLFLFSIVLMLTNSLELAVLSMLIVNILILILYDYPRARQFEILRPTIEWKTALCTLVTLLPLVFAQVCSSAVLSAPKQYLAISASQAALGIYSSVAAPTVIVQMGASYIYSPLLGEFAERVNNDKRSAINLFGKTVLGIIAVGIICSLGFILFGVHALVFLFGQDIAQYAYLLQPALLCTFITAFCWFMNDLLLAIRDYWASFAGNVVASVFTLIFFRAFVDSFGMNGVSFVGSFGYGIGVVLLAVFLVNDYRKLPDKTDATEVSDNQEGIDS